MIDVQIMESVATAIHKALNVPIYFEHKENSMHFPCVYVELVEPELELHRGDMYEHSLPLDIMYFANDMDTVTDTRALLEVPKHLFNALEFISVGDRKIRGQKMKYRITDGVLHFFVTYEGIVRSIDHRVKVVMQHLEQDGRFKDGQS